MAESVPNMPEEKDATVADATLTCDKRHWEMRKEKLPPYLRDRGINPDKKILISKQN